MFIRTESFRTYVRSYPIVTTIIVINLALYLIYEVGFVWFHILGVAKFASLFIGNNVYIAQGEWWRVVTPIFFHATFEHVFFNCVSIFLFAPPLEEMLGKWKFSIAYLGSGIISNVLTYFFGPINLQYVGASVAIFGLFGVFLFIILLRRELIDRQSKQLITIILIINLIWTFIFFVKIDVLGHLFGLLAGFVLGPILLFRTRGDWYYRRR